jgi:hypothetical protein
MASPGSSSAVPERKFRQWHLEYEAATKETDPGTLFKRVEIAEAAILNRCEALMQSSEALPERQEVDLALANLDTLKRDILKFS